MKRSTASLMLRNVSAAARHCNRCGSATMTYFSDTCQNNCYCAGYKWCCKRPAPDACRALTRRKNTGPSMANCLFPLRYSIWRYRNVNCLDELSMSDSDRWVYLERTDAKLHRTDVCRRVWKKMTDVSAQPYNWNVWEPKLQLTDHTLKQDIMCQPVSLQFQPRQQVEPNNFTVVFPQSRRRRKAQLNTTFDRLLLLYLCCRTWSYVLLLWLLSSSQSLELDRHAMLHWIDTPDVRPAHARADRAGVSRVGGQWHSSALY